MYLDPISNSRKFELEIVGDERILPKPLRIGPVESADIVSWLRIRGLCYHSRLAEDSLNAILNAYLKRGIAEVKEEIERPGFYLVNNEVVAIRWNLKEVTKDELREALELLNELATKWYSHVTEKFSTVVKWGLVAPFSFIYKQKGMWIPWLYLYGSSFTGKTTLGEIILAIWGLSAEYKKGGSSIDTVPRLGHVLSLSTFPVLINEPGVAILKEDIIETMKSAVESTTARGKFIRGSYTEIPALAPLLFTSNKSLPRDDAFLRRLLVISFTYGERIDPSKAMKFNREVNPKLAKLGALDYYIATLMALGEGLRPSDRVVELGYREGFYAVVYETKCNRYRLICEEYDVLWRELLRDEEVRRWLLEVIMRYDEVLPRRLWKQKYMWRLNDEEWKKISSSLKRKEKIIARRIYLAYQPLGGQATILALKSGKPLIIGIHLVSSNDEYYIR